MAVSIFKLGITEALVTQVKLHVQGLALVNEDKAAELLDEDGEVDVTAALEMLLGEGTMLVSRPHALLKQACMRAVAAGKISSLEFLAVWPETAEAERAPKAPRPSQVIPAEVKAPSAKPAAKRVPKAAPVKLEAPAAAPVAPLPAPPVKAPKAGKVKAPKAGKVKAPKAEAARTVDVDLSDLDAPALTAEQSAKLASLGLL